VRVPITTNVVEVTDSSGNVVPSQVRKICHTWRVAGFSVG